MAAARTTPSAREAVAALCELYWPPLYGYARRAGYSVDQAEDLTQAFFARFLEKGDVQAADPRRGRFRSFLLTSFKHFLLNERDREHAVKRGGGQRLLAFDFESAEACYAAEPVAAFTPESIFERQWAQGVVDRGLATLRAECASAGKSSTFVHLEEFILGDRSPGGYAQAAETLSATEGAIKVTVHRLRRRLRELLRAEIASTVSDDGDIDAEIQHLIAVLTR